MPCFSFSKFRKKVSLPRKHTFEEDEVSSISNVIMYSYKQLRIATEDFSPSNKIGEGGFGSVFKGILRNGELIAIKVLSEWSKQGAREFLTELKTISDIEHDCLVKLHGCCIEDSHRIIVYGYLENNSLTQTLLGGGSGGVRFDWKTRRRIAIGVARGLAFLHEEVRPHIIHRDIKASNILLDKDLNPKISDFGLAKLIPSNATHVSTRIAGTMGYLAPEYAIRGQLTRKADVYSFGVLLLEIVSGRPNTNKQLPYEEQHLLERTWKLHSQGELVALVDTALEGQFDVEEACRFFKIGLLCTQDAPKIRPSMSNVVRMLTGQISIEDKLITRPGLISDLMGFNPGDAHNKKPNGSNNTSYTISSGSDKTYTSPSTMENTSTSFATMTFTAISDRSY